MVSNVSVTLKTKLKRLGIQRIRWLVRSKYSVELAFQKEWLEEFKQNKQKVLEYWRKHRYLDYVNKICKITKDSTVLDVGCGLSSVLHFVGGKRFGVDSLADEYLKMYEYPEGITVKKRLWRIPAFLRQLFLCCFLFECSASRYKPQKNDERNL